MIELRRLAELSVRETAAALGCTESAVRSQESRGLSALRGLAAPALS